VASALARILVNPKAVSTQPAAAKVLAALLEKLRSAAARPADDASRNPSVNRREARMRSLSNSSELLETGYRHQRSWL
jgi:hypothetical protein